MWKFTVSYVLDDGVNGFKEVEVLTAKTAINTVMDGISSDYPDREIVICSVCRFTKVTD